MGNGKSREGEVVRYSRAYRVKMVATNAKHRGILGATYKIASSRLAYRSLDNENPIRFGQEDEDNMYIDLYFMKHSNALNFMNHVRGMHAVPDLVARDYFPKFEEETIREYRIESSLFTPVKNTDFKAFSPAHSIDYHSSCQDLGSMPSRSSGKRGRSMLSGSSSTRYRRKKPSSGSNPRGSGRHREGSTSSRSEAKEILFTWQSFEKRIPGDSMYSCHLFCNKFTQVTVSQNPDNFVAGYGNFHNGLDGLQCPNLVPRFVLEFLREDGVVQAEGGSSRTMVWVKLRFRNPTEANIWYPVFKNSFKDKSTFNDNLRTIESFVYVGNASEFQKNLDLKKTFTLAKWRDYPSG